MVANPVRGLGSGKYIGFGLNGIERTTIVDILDVIQTVQDTDTDTGIHLKVDEETKSRKALEGHNSHRIVIVIEK